MHPRSVVLILAVFSLLCSGACDDVNRPQGGVDAYDVEEDRTLEVPSPGVLSNDTDLNGDPLRAVQVGQPENGTLELAPTGSFRYTPQPDFTGVDTFSYRVTDGSLESKDVAVRVTVQATSDAPVSDAGQDLTVDVGDAVTLSGDASRDADGDTLIYAWSLRAGPEGSVPELTNASTVSPTFVADQSGLYQLALAVSDGSATSKPDTVLVRARVPERTPQDPARMAPPPDPGVASNLARTTAFLYTGPDAIQQGVLPGSMDPVRAAVVRGRIIVRSGEPLPGAMVSVVGHPEFGRTWSRSDGHYDLAVNGGGPLMLRFAKEGFLPSERPVDASWQDYSMVPDVAMIPSDPLVTTIDMSSRDVQVAQGSVMNDARGPRRGTLAFMPGTEASVARPDGSFERMQTLHIRISEYTVGNGGPMAMPGALPPESGYTYAVELGADEAQGFKNGGKDVIFNQPVSFYVDNFRGFPVGTPAPLGYYDNTRAAWVAIDSGAVIGVLGIVDGIAQLDTDGNGSADDGVSIGITQDERRKIAALFSAGQSFWRVRLPHLSTWDINWGVNPPPNAEAPEQRGAKAAPKVNKPDVECHSIVECQNQSLGESISVTGTPFTLHYRSDRVPGFISQRGLDIPISIPSPNWRSFPRLPDSLLGIRLSIDVAGRRIERNFEPRENQRERFVWDGLDAYGRGVQGRRPIKYRLEYRYPTSYARTDRFGYNGNGLKITGDSDGLSFFQDVAGEVSSWDARGEGLGGWSLDVHHSYDPIGRVLMLGDGTQRSADNFNAVIENFAGGGRSVDETTLFSIGSLPSLPGATFAGPLVIGGLNGEGVQPILFRRDGSFYAIGGLLIFRVNPDGSVHPFAGQSRVSANIPRPICAEKTPCGDGGPATQATFGHPFGLALGPDDSLYFTASNRIFRVTPDGVISTVIGTGEHATSPDGTPHDRATLKTPTPLAVGRDGSVFFLEDHRVRKVGPDGLIRTIAGSEGVAGYSGDGGPATLATLRSPIDLGLGPDGSLYIADQNDGNNQARAIRRITPDGTIRTFTLTTDLSRFPTRTLDVGPDGTLYIIQNTFVSNPALFGGGGVFATLVRKIDADGYVTTIAGEGGQSGFGAGDGGPALSSKNAGRGTGVSVGPDGSVYFADANYFDGNLNFLSNRIRRISPILPAFKPGEIAVPSEDGSELYGFDANGRHVRTVDTRTRAVLYRFDYDESGRLIRVTDVDDNATSIERDGRGGPLAIVSPYGQRTVLRTDSDGYLASVTNPAGEAFAMTYGTGGLLKTFTDPRQQTAKFEFDDLGRLVEDRDAAMGALALRRAEGPGGQQSTDPETSFAVAVQSPLGRTTVHGITDQRDGSQRRRRIFPDGSESSTLIRGDDSTVNTLPDGTVTSSIPGPDPRFLMSAPISKSRTVTTPSGLTSVATFERSVNLASGGDPLSLTSLTERLILNGKLYVGQYDAAKRTFTSTSPLGRTQTSRIDALGRTILEQLAGLAPVTAAYDARGRHSMLTEGTRVTTFGYASNGYLASIEDALSRRTLFEHDAVGRVTRQVLPDGQEILYGYDANGNVTSITPPGRPPHGFATNAIGLLTAYTPPGVPGLAKTGTTYTYDLDRNLTSVLRPDDLRIDYRYDTAGRLSRLELPQGYGLPAESIGYGYSATTGQLTSLSHSAGVRIDYTYDGFLPTTEIVSGLAPSPIVLERRYDGDFRLNSEKVGNTASITFAYDGDGLLTQAGALTLNRNADNGLLLGTTIGSVTDTLSYNSFGELVEYVVRSAGEEIFRTQFVRDALGRIARKTETVDRTTTTFDYAYDLAGRLTRVIRNGQPWSEYGYDANGNRISATTSVPKPKTVRATYDVQDRLLSYGDATHTHTANGELRTNTQGGRTTTYGYDVLGNLRFADLPDGRRIEYLVDGRGRRVGKKINGVLVQGFVYGSQLAPATELDGKGNVVARFVYGTDLNVPEYMTKNGSTYRIITDHLGSPRMVVDASSGAVVQRIDYDEWGVTLNDSNPSFTPFGFAGGLHDEEVGLERFGARDYDPTMGRWLIKDPILFRGGDLNLFQYAGTDPVNVVDANGYDVIGGSVLPGAFPIPPGALPIPPGGISVPPTEPMPPGGILTPPTGDGDLPAGSDGGCGPTDGEGGVPAYLAEGETSEQGPKDNDKGKGKGKEKDKDGRVPRGKRGNVDDEAARLGDAENDPNLKRKGNRFNKSKQDLKQQIKNQYGGT